MLEKNNGIENLYNKNTDVDKYNDEDFWNSVKKIKKMNDDYYKETGRRKTSLTVTYGCQMNEHDSEKIAWILELMGYEATNDEEKADFLVYNTCAIRENAELKVYGKVGSLKTVKEDNPDLKIAVCGCMMQLDEIRNTIETKHKQVDLIFGTHNIHRLPILFEENLRTNKQVVDILDDNLELIEGLDNNRQSTYKAYVNIMFGCNNFCTYCVVPYTRGREISRAPEDIIKEVKELADDGYKEIMLLGQNVNSYGKSLNQNYTFTDLLTEIDQIDGIERIRFMTSHPKDLSEELIAAYGKLNNLSNHLHLPIQSGSNDVLRRMNRNYTREQYLKNIRKIREVKPDISITTDIMVGFPGETEEDFQDTVDLIREVEFDFVYNFIFSLREGTKAEEMDDQLAYEVKHRRFEELSNVINEIILKNNKKLIGKELRILVEEVSKTDPNKMTGRTDDFKLVHFEGDSSLIGEIVTVRISDAKTFSMEGSRINN